MIKKLLWLEWLSFRRSASYNFNLGLKIILGIAGIFYGFLILSLGIIAYFALDEEGYEPLFTINQFLIYWVLADLVIRYFLQKAPITFVRPLLIQSITKKRLTHYLLGKSAFSFFNIYPSLFFLPFSITLLVNGYSIFGVIAWHLAIMSITFFMNYLNLAINNKDWLFAIIAVLVAGTGLSQYYGIFDITVYTAPIFQLFYDYPLTVLIPIGLLVLMYRFNFSYFLKALYLDDAIKISQESVNIRDYSWLERFGLMGTFLKNDLRLILRNKRSKNTLFMSVFFLFYGFFIFNTPGYDNDFWLLLAGTIIPAGFLLTFGGFVPSWDSAYYQFMMSQNIRYREYLASKWWLMVIATIISMIFCSIYLVLGTKYYLAILVGGIYNIGINSLLTLLAGAYVKTPIDLTTGKKPFGDSSSFNMKTVLLGIPKIVLPIIFYYSFRINFGETVGFIAVGAFGLVGLLFRNFFFNLIENIYKQEKYSTIKAYKEG